MIGAGASFCKDFSPAIIDARVFLYTLTDFSYMFEKFATIKSKQLVLAVFVSAVPLLLVGQLINVLTMDQISSDVRDELRQVVRDKALSIEQWVNERKSDIHMLASTVYVKSLFHGGDPKGFHEFYDTFAEQYGNYKHFCACDLQENLIYSFPEPIEYGVEIPELPEPQYGRSVVSDAFLWKEKAHILIVSPVEDNERIIGEVVVITSLDDVNGITDNIQVGDTGEAYLVDSRGYFVTHKNRSSVLKEHVKEADPIRRLISGEEKVFVGEFVDYRGVPVLGAYYYLPEMGWGLVAEQDVEEAFEPTHNMNRTIILLVVVSSLFAALIAYSLSANILRPLGVLKKTIEKIREGEHDTRFPVRRRDEIGITGEIFNEMLERLEKTQQMLKKRVEAADRELISAHRELQARHKQLMHAQKQLLRTERLSTMGEVAAGLAHEINNPLTTIKMLINSIEDDDVISSERRHALRIIAEEINKVASMIGRFMDLTHPRKMRSEPIVIEKVIDRTMALVRPKLDGAGITVSFDIPKEIPSVVGDERQLGQLLLNLILNSINAMPNGGTIKISAEEHSDKESGRRYLRIKFSDTGSGISEVIINKIFNPFFTTRADGTGLGLSIVARIVESHGGYIKVRSAPGAGTTFFIDLPES